MKVKSLEAIFGALQEAEARYLVVGGVAVIAHGYVRLTENLCLDLDVPADTLSSAISALKFLGYRKTEACCFSSDCYFDVTINLSSKERFLFDIEFAAGEWRAVTPDIQIRVVSMAFLIAKQEKSNRRLDLIDADKLRKLQVAGPMKVNEPSEPWPCDWEGAELYQLRRDASRSFRENLIWLEEATEFAEAFAKAPWHKEGIKPSTPQNQK